MDTAKEKEKVLRRLTKALEQLGRERFGIVMCPARDEAKVIYRMVKYSETFKQAEKALWGE